METDGEKGIVGMENGSFSIFDIKKQEIISTFRNERQTQGPITSIALSNEADLLIAASSDCTVSVWK